MQTSPAVSHHQVVIAELIQSPTNQAVYSLPNMHGDIFATTNAAGTLLGTTLTGPFGEKISGQTNPNNTATNATLGWVGQHEKTTETSFTLQSTQMGARVYLPTLGRFLQVDPIEGGVENSYVYPPDAVNDFDLTGMLTRSYSVSFSRGVYISIGLVFDGKKTYLNMGGGGGTPGVGVAAMYGNGSAHSGWNVVASGGYGKVGGSIGWSKKGGRSYEAGLMTKGLSVGFHYNSCLTCRARNAQKTVYKTQTRFIKDLRSGKLKRKGR